jgi:hypothetical protein
MERGFRVRDRVSVHGLIRTNGEVVPGRVICNNRKSKYGESVIVLYEYDGVEMLETFLPNGHRWLSGSSCRITLGHP